MMPTGTIRCPQCQKPTAWEGNDFRPFCSERCRLIDLGAWLDESYSLPSGSAQDSSDQEESLYKTK
jgi:hypothetical protein